jgi:hypothetical protein
MAAGAGKCRSAGNNPTQPAAGQLLSRRGGQRVSFPRRFTSPERRGRWTSWWVSNVLEKQLPASQACALPLRWAGAFGTHLLPSPGAPDWPPGVWRPHQQECDRIMQSVARDWRIAIHEAGHLVAARLLWLPGCGGASIIEPHAHADFPANCGPPSICALMGGACAETIMLGDYDRVGVTSDSARIRERLARYGADGGELWHYTTNLLRPQRGLLTRVAIKLRRAQVLDGGEIDRIVCWQAERK